MTGSFFSVRPVVYLALVLGLLVVASTVLPPAVEAQTLSGFTSSRSADQLDYEKRLLSLPSADAFREHLQRITVAPHPTGSEANRRVADYLATVMQEAGLEVERFTYDVYLPTLDSDIDVALVTPVRLPLNNQEYILKEDRFSGHPALKPGWNAYSGTGDVTAEVVYANYGRKEDFEQLEQMGISVKGKVVIARYGGNFRGYKAKYAEQHGAVGLIIYSDPANGGYAAGAAYPEGRFISESTIQRGSVLTLDYTGDPLTPFEPALPAGSKTKVKRLDPEDVAFHSIPVTPLPYGSAVEILKRMQGDPVPSDWQGGLPFTYRLTGGTDLTVRLHVSQPFQLTPAVNIVGTLKGTAFPDEWVILGSHYDAWGYGACDPNGGTAMLLTLAQTLGQLAEEGFRPRRTIKIAHWDAEEYGIIGSTEWVEHFRTELTARAVAYINADMSVTGARFGSSASPSLKQSILEAAGAVPYHGSEGTIYDHWLQTTPTGNEPNPGNLGGGSDHVGFYTHIGVPSADLSMNGSAPIYHSNYDDFAWFERFADTGFVYGPNLAQVDGVLATRLANADILPYDVVRYSTDLKAHLEGLEKRSSELDISIRLPHLAAAIDTLNEVTSAFETVRTQRIQSGDLSEALAQRVNRGLIGLEKAFLYAEGLQNRPWSRSLYVSPDPFSGYASWMLPGLRYQIETGAPDGIEAWETIYVQAVEDLTRRVDAITALLR